MSSVQKRFIQEQHRSIRNRLDPDAITPYLRQQGLLTDDESDELLGSSLTRSGKIDLIVKSLPSKGKGWWNKFLQCLRESATKPGLPAHQELAELLENELVQLKEQKICIQRICAILQTLKKQLSMKTILIIFVAVIVIVLPIQLYYIYSSYKILASQLKETADAQTRDKDGYQLYPPAEATESSQAVSCTPTTSRVVQTPEAPGPGPVDFNSFLVTQKFLNKTHCLFYFIVENRTMPYQFANSKLWNILNLLDHFPNMYGKYISILESLLTTFNVSDEDYYSPLEIATALIDLLETTSVSFTKTIQQDCRIDDTYWLVEVVCQQFAAG